MLATMLDHEVKESLDRADASFNQGRPEFFEQFAADATIFTADCTEPIKGREAYRQKYETILSQGLQKTILDRRVQIVGDKAVVTQKARIEQSGKAAVVSQTMVYGTTGEGLKVLHSQTSLVPQTGETSERLPGAVRVVKERIATAASVVGVAQ
jgi:ketosteroid isomerase-like protein